MAGIGIIGRDVKSLPFKGLLQAEEDFFCGGPVFFPFQDFKGQGEHPEGHYLVVEHFLKMGDGPPAVNAIAKESSLKVIVEAAPLHGIEGFNGDGPRQGVFFGGKPVKEEQQGRVGREFLAATKPAILLVVIPGQFVYRGSSPMTGGGLSPGANGCKKRPCFL